jgi:hypothetical protein
MGLSTFGAPAVSEPPIGTTVDTLLVGNDPTRPNWVKMNSNTLINTSIYPNFTGITEGSYHRTQLPASNLPSLVTGNWVIKTALKAGGYFMCVASDSVTPTLFSRSFRSTDGITWSEVGNLPNASSYLQQAKLYYFNSKFYCVSTRGVHESSDNGGTWTQKTTTYYYSMGYNAGLFLLTTTSGQIDSTTDLVTYTQRYTSASSTQPLTGIIRSAAFGKFYSVVNNGSGTKVIHSTSGTSEWTEVSIATNNPIYESIVEFNGVLYVFTRTGGIAPTGWIFKSTDGTTFTDCSAEFGATQSQNSSNYSDQVIIATANLLIHPTGIISPASPQFRDLSGRTGRATDISSHLNLSTDGTYIWGFSPSSNYQIIIYRLPDVDLSNTVITPVADKMLRVY